MKRFLLPTLLLVFRTSLSMAQAGPGIQILTSGNKLENHFETVSEVIHLANVRASEIFPLVESMLTVSLDLQGNQRVIGRVEVNEGLNVLIVTDLSDKVGNIKAVIKSLDKKGYEGFPTLETQTFVMNFAKASEVLPEIQSRLTSKGGASAVDDQHVIIVRDVPSNLKYLEGIVAKLDVRRKQVRIRGKIVEILDGESLDWGLEGDASFSADKVRMTPSLNVSPGLSEGAGFGASKSGSFTFNARLNFLAKSGKAKVVSNFGMDVLDNAEGLLRVDDTASGTSNGRGGTGSTGISLLVTPRINQGQLITLDLVATVRGLNLDPLTAQFMTSQSVADTEIILNAGQEGVLGGLTRDRVRKVRAGLPFLKDIPLLGLLFSRVGHHVSKTEIMILLSAEVIEPTAPTATP